MADAWRSGRTRRDPRCAAASADCALNAWPSDPEPIVRTMSLALEDAGLVAADVDVVYASANATARLDEVEARALVTLFGGSRTVVTSIKGAIGEGGASSAAACVAAALCGAAGRVPPIAGLQDRIRSHALCGWRRRAWRRRGRSFW